VSATNSCSDFKGIVPRKRRLFKSGFDRKLFLYSLGAYIFHIYLKGHHPLNSTKPDFAFDDHKNELCEINIAPTANSLYQCTNFNHLIYTSKLLSSISNLLVFSALA
jgi:hypothetical protein